MKKALSILLMLLFLLTAGCSLLPDTSDSGSDDVVTTTTTTTTTTASDATTFITEEKAVELASDYWGVRPGDRDPDTGFLFSIMVFDTPTEENPQYKVALRWLVNDSHFSTVDQVLVNAVTGEVYYPS